MICLRSRSGTRNRDRRRGGTPGYWLQTLPEWNGLGALTQLSIDGNVRLQTVGAMGQLSRLEELRLEGRIVPAVLAQAKALPMLQRLMLSTDHRGVNFVRPDNLPSV